MQSREEPRATMLPLPDTPRVVYNRTPLVLAICQLRFSSVLSIAELAYVAPFQRAIQDTYPVSNPVQATAGFQIQFGPGVQASEANVQQGSAATGWQFTDREGIWSVLLSLDTLSLETRGYVHFEDFLGRWRKLLNSLVEHFHPTIATRLGLRYINEIRSNQLPEGLTWSQIVRAELLGPLAVPDFTEHTVQFADFQQLVLRYPEQRGMTINHGLVPGGTTVRSLTSGQVPDDAFYLLDVDVYHEFPPPGGLVVDPTRICDDLEEAHGAIHRLFHWSLTETYFSSLTEADNADNAGNEA